MFEIDIFVPNYPKNYANNLVGKWIKVLKVTKKHAPKKHHNLLFVCSTTTTKGAIGIYLLNLGLY